MTASTHSPPRGRPFGFSQLDHAFVGCPFRFYIGCVAFLFLCLFILPTSARYGSSSYSKKSSYYGGGYSWSGGYSTAYIDRNVVRLEEESLGHLIYKWIIYPPCYLIFHFVRCLFKYSIIPFFQLVISIIQLFLEALVTLINLIFKWFVIMMEIVDKQRTKLDPLVKATKEQLVLPVQNALSSVMDKVMSIVVELYGKCVEPVIGIVGDSLTALTNLFVWRWASIIQPVLSAVINPIINLFVWFWESVIQLVINAVGDSLAALTNLFVWRWESIIQPVFNVVINPIINLFIWGWESILQPVISAVVNSITQIFVWFWENIIQSVLQPAIVAGSDKLMEIFGWIWENVVQLTHTIFSEITFLEQFLYEKCLVPALAFCQSVIQYIYIYGVEVLTWLFRTLEYAGSFLSYVFEKFVNHIVNPLFEILNQAISWLMKTSVVTSASGAINRICNVLTLPPLKVEDFRSIFKAIFNGLVWLYRFVEQLIYPPFDGVTVSHYTLGLYPGQKVQPIQEGEIPKFVLPDYGPIVIKLRNNYIQCNCELYVDGKKVLTFRMDSGSTYSIPHEFSSQDGAKISAVFLPMATTPQYQRPPSQSGQTEVKDKENDQKGLNYANFIEVDYTKAVTIEIFAQVSSS